MTTDIQKNYFAIKYSEVGSTPESFHSFFLYLSFLKNLAKAKLNNAIF